MLSPPLEPRKEHMVNDAIFPIATAIIVLIVVIVGGIVCITDPQTLSFKQYVDAVALAAGLLAVGRGIHSRVSRV